MEKSSSNPRGRPFKERPEERLTHRVVTDLDDDLHDLLSVEIEELGTRQAKLIRQYIVDGLRGAGYEIPLSDEEET